MANVNICNHSRDAYLYQWLLINEEKHGGFNDAAYDALLEDIKKTGNTQLFSANATNIDSEQLKQDATAMSDRIWDGL